MTVCNMSIEGGARFGYINPDRTTFNYIKGRKYAPDGNEYDRAVEFWKSTASDPDADYDDIVELDVTDLAPMVTWGINPGHAIEVTDKIPSLDNIPHEDKATAQKALEHMKLREGQSSRSKDKCCVCGFLH